VIYGSVTRQKQMANVFGEEVDAQVQLLGQIEGKVDRNVLSLVCLSVLRVLWWRSLLLLLRLGGQGEGGDDAH